ncbi:HAMP domain-containing histidine kinase [Vibrio kyushuensis]|uniref:sensor histidine kinase n=1 Tax=Vibrio kyushuensis TaxID=2910249 RepID=UPI003D0B8ABD
MGEGSFFNIDSFMPHGMCYAWRPDILWTSVISDVVTALAYFSITIAVVVFVRKRKDLPYPWFFILAGSIIFLACGLSHLVGAIVIWKPIYGVSAVVKAITAVTSLATGVWIWFLLPFFLSIPSPSMLEAKNKALKNSLDKLSTAQQDIIESQKLASLGHLMSGMAHELNTPLGASITAVSYMEEVVKNSKGKEASEETKDLIKSLEEAINIASVNLTRSASLVKIFKQVAAEGGTLDDRPFDVKEFLSDIINSLVYKHEITSEQVSLNCPDDLRINANHNRFIVILTHLFSNSVEHSFSNVSDGKIDVKVSLEGTSKLVILFQDNGVGMNGEQVAKIFEPFYTTRRGGGGTGLGMTIVYNTISNMKGEIRCQSSLGEGTLYEIIVPVEVIS